MHRTACVWLLVAFLSFTSFASSTPPSSIVFEPNVGQTAKQVQFLARTREGTFFFTQQGFVLSERSGTSVSILLNTTTAPVLYPEGRLISVSNYLPSDQAENWLPKVPNYSALMYQNAFPGIDLRLRARGQHVEQEFVLAPGADATDIRFTVEGTDGLSIGREGDILIGTAERLLHESRPHAWQVMAGKRKGVRAAWKIASDGRLGFVVGSYDHSQPLIIDPVLQYSTHLGGTTGLDRTLGTTFLASSSISAVAVDTAGNMYVAGTTSATNFPTTAGAYSRTANFTSTFHDDTVSNSGFVTKFNRAGDLVWSTYLHSRIEDIAVDSAQNVYTAKSTRDDFNGPTYGYDAGIKVDKLNSSGSALLYSYAYGATPLNASVPCQNAMGNSSIAGLASDNFGHVWIAGSTVNPCLITTAGAFQRTLPYENGSGYVAKLDTTKSGDVSIVYSTYLGGGDYTTITALAVDAGGYAYVSGSTSSDTFPHSRVFGTDKSARGFLSKLNTTASALVFSNLIYGGLPASVALGPANSIYVAGDTSSAVFPTTTAAFRRAIAGAQDGFVTAFSNTGGSLIFSTYLGGSANDHVSDVAVNNSGMAFVVGDTQSTNFPVTANAFKKSIYSGADEAFVTAMTANGQALYYSTFLGGSNNSKASAIALDPAWNAYVVGATQDNDFPVSSNAYQYARHGTQDGFLSRIVIAADLQAAMSESTTTPPRNGTITYYARVTNLGPDGSDNVVLRDAIPAGFTYGGLYTSTASSCTAPALNANSGTVVCTKTRLERGRSFYVNIYLHPVAPVGTALVNTVQVSAKTQDLNTGNNRTTLKATVR